MNHTKINKLAQEVRSLGPWEKRVFLAHAPVPSFHFDILTNLPFELLSEVASYLDFVDVYVLQRVSRAWKKKLSDLRILRMALSPWFRQTSQPASSSQSRHENDETSAVAAISEKACVLQNLRRGRVTAHQYFEFDNHYSHDFGFNEHAAVIWMVEASVIYFCDLEKAVWHHLHTLADDPVVEVFLVNHWVIYNCETGVCYAVDTHTKELKVVQLPQNKVKFAAGASSQILLGLGYHENPQLVMWDIDANESRVISLTATLGLASSWVGFNSVGATISQDGTEAIILSVKMGKDPSIRPSLFRTTLSWATGCLKSEREFSLPPRCISIYYCRLQPTGQFCQYEVCRYADYFRDDQHNDGVSQRNRELCGVILYDHNKDEISLREWEISLPPYSEEGGHDQQMEEDSTHQAIVWDQLVISTPRCVSGEHYDGQLKLTTFPGPHAQQDFLADIKERSHTATDIAIPPRQCKRWPDRTVHFMGFNGKQLMFVEDAFVEDVGDRSDVRVHLLSFERHPGSQQTGEIDTPESLPLMPCN